MTVEQTSLVETNFQWAKDMASHFHRKKGGDIDELESAAMLGLLKAAERFDPARGVAFRTLAYRKINGHLQDDVRRRMTETGWTRNGPKWTQHAKKTSWPELVYTNGAARTKRAFEPGSERPDYDFELWRDETFAAKLNRRSQVVVSQLMKGYTKRDIATAIGVGPTRVSQLAAKALRQLATA